MDSPGGFNSVIQKHRGDENVTIISNSVLEPLHGLNQNFKCATPAACQQEFPSAYAVHTGLAAWYPTNSVLQGMTEFYGQVRDNWQIVAIVFICVTILLLVLLLVMWVKLSRARAAVPPPPRSESIWQTSPGPEPEIQTTKSKKKKVRR